MPHTHMISLLNRTCFQIIVRNSQIVLGNVRHFIWRFSRWLSDMEIIRLWCPNMNVSHGHNIKSSSSPFPRLCQGFFKLFYYSHFEVHHSLRPFLWVEFSSKFKAKAFRREAIWSGWARLCLCCKRFIRNVIIVSLQANYRTRSRKSTRQGRSTQRSWATGAVSVVATTSRPRITIWIYMKMNMWKAHRRLFGVKPGSFLSFYAFWWKTCQTSLKR